MLDERIRAGLSAPEKVLPSELLYDALGSMLFEAITLLPEYGLTRAEERLIDCYRAEMISLGGELEIVELGPGAGHKAQSIVTALRQRQSRVRYTAVDVSARALSDCKSVVEQVHGVEVLSVQDTFLEGLEVALRARSPGIKTLVLFLGSNLSNFERPEALEFLCAVRRLLHTGDALLLATDLEKSPSALLPAYDDALGVTAAFNRNVLSRLNREWDADFLVRSFSHEARWNTLERRVEMHLRAETACDVSIPRLDLAIRLRRGETIRTESSARFSLAELSAWARQARFRVAKQWVDGPWPFAQTVLEAT